MEQDEVIRLSYVKNSEEKNVIVSSRDALETKEVLKISQNKTTLTIASDIELLHLSKISFLNITKIECQNPETILILDQCQFKKAINFLKGNIVLDSPEFINATGEFLPYNISFQKNEYVEFILGEENNYENNIYQIKDVRNVRISGNASRLTIKEPNCIGSSKLQTLHIKNAKHYHAGVLDAQNIIIEDSEVESIANLKYKKLTISNSSISSNYNNYVLNLNQGEVHIKNAILKGKTIILPDGTYEPESGSLIYFGKLDRENLLAARLNLITCLEKRKEQSGNKPVPLNCKQLKQLNQIISESDLRETPYILNHQSLEEYYKKVASTMISNPKRVRIRNY